MGKYFYSIEFSELIQEHITMLRIVPTSDAHFQSSKPRYDTWYSHHLWPMNSKITA